MRFISQQLLLAPTHLRPLKWRMSLPILEEEEAHERKAGMAIEQQPRADKSASLAQFYLSGCGIHADDHPISLVRGVADDHAVEEVGNTAKTQEKQPVAAIHKS